MPPWFIRLPARIKKGIAVRLNLLMPTKIRCAPVTTDTSSETVCKIATRDAIPMEYEIGTPTISSTASTPMIISKDSIAIVYAPSCFVSVPFLQISAIFNTV